ncbi:hypothetical protein EDD21DRAFT_299997 [Dissophora ornata]|nr:hypothetical protein EDD21DRAFT_299997 [Dissophora ornata]
MTHRTGYHVLYIYHNPFQQQIRNFCAVPNVSVPCLPGFYCPENTAQPTLCCRGYLCSPDATTIEVCPEGFFCPTASIRALPCNFLAFCPRGTSAIEKYGLGAFLVAFGLVVMGVFSVKKRIFRAQRLRYRQRLPAAAAGNMNVSTMTLPKAERSFDIRFEKLGLTLPTGVDIIKNISGRLITGRTCAVMGPSGAGKTTFLSILAGKVPKTDGSIKVNGKEQTLSLWKKLIGFVPQEDVMLSELTVREILMHSARMRQPVHMSHNEKRLKVLEVIQFLGIGHIMDNPIGDVETRGISGGERKRVNIGMELVASPSILFLDEPTSGLDSATSLEVCKLLKQIAQEQFLTVAAVVHSPSPHAFSQFDDLLLLGAGGRVVYSGPRDEAAEYFENIGYSLPSDENPADFFIALAAGRVNKLPTGYDNSRRTEEKRFSASLPHDQDCRVSTMALHQPSRPQSPTYSVPISNLAGSSEDTRDIGDSKTPRWGLLASIRISLISTWAGISYWCTDVAEEFSHWLWSIKCKFTGEKDPVRETPSFGIVFILCFKRACLQNYRSQLDFLWDQALHLACGLCVSFASKDMMYTPRQPAEICAMAPPSIQLSCATPLDDIRYVGMFLTLGVFFAGINVGACTFGDEKAVFWRDTSAGMPTLPYYLAKVLADVPRMIVASFMYTGAFIFFYAYHEQLSSLMVLVLLLYVNAFAMGYFVSTVVSRSMFGLSGTGMSLTWALVLSGTAPHLYKVMTSSGYTYFRWVWNVSAPRWAVEAFYLKEMESRNYNEIKHNLLGDTYSFDNYQKAIFYMVYISLGWNIISFSLMKLLNRHKVK